MLDQLRSIRPDERRPTAWAFGALSTFMGGHALLETARDALFLAKVPVSRLPWVYLGIAVLALILSAWHHRETRSARLRTSVLLWSAAAVALAFWPLALLRNVWALYALYVWSGSMATLVVAELWLLLGRHFTVSHAKRLYPIIGAGSLVGAIAGSAAASALAFWLPSATLLPAAAALFVVSGALTAGLERSLTKSPTAPLRNAVLAAPRRVLADAYVKRLLLLGALSAITLTCVDFAFKSAVIQRVPRASLAEFFGATYFALNVGSLLVQLLLLRPLLATLNVTGAILVLPAALGALAALTSIVFGAFTSGALLKVLDGTLRHSLHRTASELLLVPVSDSLRSAAKTLVDALGQRGGQALGSLLILGVLALDPKGTALWVLLVSCAAAWLGLSLAVRRPYVELFRTTLRDVAHNSRLGLPEFDLSSLESVLVALNSQQDSKVQAALRLLDHSGRAHVIPALILYHPAPAVVSDALEVLQRSGRKDHEPIVERLLDHATPEIRATVLRSRLRVNGDPALARRFMQDPSPIVSVVAKVALVAHNWATAEEQSELELMLQTSDEAVLVAALECMRTRPAPVFEDWVIALAQHPSAAVKNCALGAMGSAPSARYLPVLMRLLTQRDFRVTVRSTLVAMGDTAQSYLEGALFDDSRPLVQRRHIPRTLIRMDAARAARALLERLPVEPDGVTRYKILRALNQMRREEPKLKLNQAVLEQLVEQTVMVAYRLLFWHVELRKYGPSAPPGELESHQLLTQLVLDKYAHAVERLMLTLALCYPKEDLSSVLRGLNSPVAAVRASSRELLEYVLPSARRAAVLGLVDESSPEERLRSAPAGTPVTTLSFGELIQQLLESQSESISALAAYHVEQLRSIGVRVDARVRPADASSPSASGVALLRPLVTSG